MFSGIVHRLRNSDKLQHGMHGILFKEILGHKEIKKIINNAILCKNPVHVLLVGRPGSAKTMFLLEVYRIIKGSLFVVGSNTTKAGLLDQLFEMKPKFLLIDEIEKMNKQDQISLLNLMETGIISEIKMNKTREMLLKCRVFACANSCEKIPEPLLSRFLVLEIPEYSYIQFKEIVAFSLKKEDVREDISNRIAEKVWHELRSKDIRDAIKIGRLSTSFEDTSFIVNMMKKRTKINDESEY